MAETIKIGGELESTATGNVVAAASAIKDKVKNKYQGEINAETDATLANHASAIQGLNSQNYVTVTATDQTTDVTDVLPAEGSEDTIYRLGNWDGTQYDVTCYSEYSWNGSAYVHISTKPQIGEVFDISAYHASGGTLVTYADLSAALDSNNGGGVPQSLQKGGMSVKFVRTYDNKYVQFRCMSDEFTTDVAQWQGVDDKPTANSCNLVKSGGVFPAINAVNKSLIPINGKVSIIGDSISTYSGTMPSGYVSYYPNSTSDVTSLYDMWWHLLLSMTNSALEINASWGGSAVTHIALNVPNFYDRTNILGSPDYIFVALGTNDSLNGIALGDYDYETEDLSESEFIPAYIKGVKALKTNYPTAKIVLFVFQMADSYAIAIENIGKHYELDVIDVRSYYVNNVHPNKSQMSSVAQTICSFYIKGIVDDVPTAGSENLVKSGGVAKEIAKEMANFNGKRHSIDSVDLDITDKDGNVIARFYNCQIKTKGFNSVNAAQYTGSQYDFEIVDKNGNVILRVDNGNITTKFFDSTTTPRTISIGSDFCVTDTDGNIILKVNNGHIKTKLFDSEQNFIDFATQINDGFVATSASDAQMVIDEKYGFVFVTYSIGFGVYGEAHSALMMSIFPLGQPYNFKSVVIGQNGETSSNLISLGNGSVRVIYSSSYYGGDYYYRDYIFNPTTKEWSWSEPHLMKCNGENVNRTNINSYITSQGYSVEGESTEIHIVGEIKKYNGILFGTITGFNERPVIWYSNDNCETIVPFSVFDQSGQFEADIAIYNNNVCLVNRAQGTVYYSYATINLETYNVGTWSTPVALPNAKGSRPQICLYSNKLSITYTYDGKITSSFPPILDGRTGLAILMASNIDLSDKTFYKWVSKYGIVYPRILVNYDDIYCAWSTSKIGLDEKNTSSSYVQAKESIMFNKLK